MFYLSGSKLQMLLRLAEVSCFKEENQRAGVANRIIQ